MRPRRRRRCIAVHRGGNESYILMLVTRNPKIKISFPFFFFSKKKEKRGKGA